ncbi:Gfo/Idh/MocA family oxidoreductase [Sandaracinomonas limnophila]|uniref:Gfo/Idh/MocA family oxidoreductase n=1 Tax=Sandaracinomonas limnophila TaxID=1862386 RepID=A0A437PTL9_9BACT|nr:Gfo/Idh/MocA family oxidoreductase [Sandaracinomonas limnophila]RVU25577.1 Gfo/Idh/MocA family oxidoreductase [Sandaracinomonas limnophila]
MSTRRTFIQSLALPLLANSFKPLKAKPEIAEGSILRFAQMGLGSYAERVGNAVKESTRAKITGLISGSPEKLSKFASKYGVESDSLYNYSNVASIKNNASIDAVYITTPNALHCPNTIQIAEAGKHVICEKPMAINAKEAQKMIDACQQNGVKLLIGYRMHFEPITLEIVRMRQRGEFGKTLFFQGLSGFIIGDPSQWRLKKELAGGGAMMDIGVYSINGARYMLGEDPIWVTAQETKTNFEKFKDGVDETITFQMGFPSGATASCLSTYSLNYLDKFYLTGTKGFAEMQPSTGYGPIKGRTHLGEIQKQHITHQARQMDEMAAIILDNKVPEIPVDGQEGLKDMFIVDAIFKAVKTGKKINIQYEL